MITNFSSGDFINADCFTAAASIPDKSIDLIVTSPPYNANKAYEGKRNLEEYEKFASKLSNLFDQKVSDNGSLWLNVGYTKISSNETLPLTYLYYPLLNGKFRLVQELVWHFTGGMAYKKRFTHRTERWQWWARNPDTCTFNLDEVRVKEWARFDKRNNPLGKNPTDYWFYNRVAFGGKEKTNHPCQFPREMIERIIKACSNPSDIILDPLAGAGTTAIAAQNCARKWICIEQDENYYKEALERVRNNEATI